MKFSNVMHQHSFSSPRIATIVLLLIEHSIEIIHFVCGRVELLAERSEQFLVAFCQPPFYMMAWRMYLFGQKMATRVEVFTI